MKPTTIEMSMDGHRVLHFHGILDAAGWQELQRRWDMFKEGDARTHEDCKAVFNNLSRFDRNPFKDEPCGYPLDKL